MPDCSCDCHYYCSTTATPATAAPRLAEAFPAAHAGGAWWFVDLAAVDATFALPLISGASALSLVPSTVIMRVAVP